MSSPTLSPSGEMIRPGALSRSHPTARTISALVLREMTTRFGRTPGGFLWALLQPLATIIILGMAFSLLARSPALGTSFILFKATGMMPFQTFRSNATMVGGSISYSRSLLLYPGVTWVDALLARFILNTLVMIVVTALILVGVVLVIATAIGAEGLEITHETHALIADQPADFAAQCCRIMEDRQLAARLTANAIECLKTHYTLDSLRQNLGRMIV